MFATRGVCVNDFSRRSAKAANREDTMVGTTAQAFVKEVCHDFDLHVHRS